MIKIKSETTKKTLFAILLFISFVPLFIITKYAGFTGRLISSIIYSLIGMFVLYEVLISFNLNKYVSIVSTIAIPLFFVLPNDNFINLVDGNGVGGVSLMIKKAISSWKNWIIVMVISLIPITVQSNKRPNANIFISQALVTIVFLIVAAFAKILWVYNLKGIEMILFFVAISTISDTGGYFGGKYFGKKWFKGKKLAPSISPKKTWAGFVIGTILAIIFGVLYGYFVGIWKDFKDQELLVAFIAAIILSLVSPLGDLFFSSIKRIMNIKDFSNIIPGHGGFMDRLDAISFVTIFSGILFLFVFS